MEPGIMHAKTLRTLSDNELPALRNKRKKNGIYFLLENIYDTYNIGALFRLADAVGAEKLYLAGDMETPPNPKISNASIGTDRIVPWEYYKEPIEAIRSIKGLIPDITIVAVELHARAKLYTKINWKTPLLLIIGNETFGITPKTLSSCQNIAVIPMYGVNKSLNVIVAAGIIAYWVLSQQIYSR